MGDNNTPSTEKSNAAGTTPQQQGQTEQPVQAPMPQAQVQAAPRFVRQAYSGPMGYTGGGIAGGPLSGFSGMMGGAPQQQQQQQGYMGGGLSPQMMYGGGLAAPQAQTTAGLVQQYNPFAAAAQMPAGPQFALPAAATTDETVGQYGQDMGQYAQPGMYDPGLMEPDLGGEQQNVYPEDPTGEFGTVQGEVQIDPETGLVEDIYEESGEEPSIYAEPEGELAEWDPHESGQMLRDGEGWAQDDAGTWFQWNSEEQRYTKALGSGDLVGLSQTPLDDGSFQHVMGRNIQGYDPNDKFRVGEAGTLHTDDLDRQYAEEMENRERQIVASKRAFSDWANRSGIAFNPSAMGQAAGAFQSRLSQDQTALDRWHEGEIAGRESAVRTAHETAFLDYGDNIEDLIRNHFSGEQNELGEARVLHPEYKNYVRALVGRMTELDMSENQIQNAIGQSMNLFNAEYPDLQVDVPAGGSRRAGWKMESNKFGHGEYQQAYRKTTLKS